MNHILRKTPLLLGFVLTASIAQSPHSVFIEELTWVEVRGAIDEGKTTIIVPTGGTEQNGPHMVLGKHNYLVNYKAGEIASQLGDALVAPVVAYVPEGDIDPPTSHMRFAGTISIPENVFADILEFAARSFKQHGFLDIAFLGDSGGNQAAQKVIAEKLTEEWTEVNVRVHHVSDFYPGRGDNWVISQNISEEDVGGHAGTHDTSSLLHLNPSMLRLDQMKLGRPGDGQGHTGNPAVSTPEFGERILEMQIEDAVDQITKERLASRQ